MTTATDRQGAVLQCIRSTPQPAPGSVLSLMCPDPEYGRVRFICRAVKAVPFGHGDEPGAGYFSVRWLAIASLKRRSHLENALATVGIGRVPSIDPFPEDLPDHHELIYTAASHEVTLVALPTGHNRVRTDQFTALVPPYDWP